MSRKNPKSPRLQDRDYEILEHLLQYRLTTPEVLHKLFFQDSDRNAVTKVTSRLTQHGFIAAHPLFASNTYFGFGPDGAKLYGLAPKHAKPLGVQSLITEYGTLAYCCLGATQRQRLRVGELYVRYPQLLRGRIDSSHYYLDHDGELTRIGYIRVDGGGTPDHVVRKCQSDIEQRLKHPPFAEVIEAGRFLIGVATFTQPKAETITRRLEQLIGPVKFRVEVAPNLVNLLAL